MRNKKRKAAYIQITRKCNNECIFCSNPSFDYELSFDKAKKIILDYKRDGVNEIILSGGEPTTHKKLLDVIKFLKKNNFDIKVVTNGVNFSDFGYVLDLKKGGLNDVHVSIHTHIKKIAEELSQRKGHLEKTLRGINNALNVGMNVSINSTINSKNSGYLSDFIGFMIKKFPAINHYVFNNLDPGNADSITVSRAWKNKWIIARFVDMELELSKTAKLLLKNNKTFRIERVPLCYMQGFEQFSTETRRLIKQENYICYFLEKMGKNFLVKLKPKNIERRVKGENCKFCPLNKICAGISSEYAQIHGYDELFPVFDDPKPIIKKILG